MNGRRIFDWRFVAMFCVMLLVSVAAYAFVRRVNQTDALVDTARQAAHTSAEQAVELGELRKANEELQADSARRSRVASAERDQLARQVTQLQRELVALTTYLRQHNINVPSSVTSPRAGVTRPKVPAPGPRGPAGPPGGPTGAPTPTPGVTDPLCALLPSCVPLPLSLPTPLLPNP